MEQNDLMIRFNWYEYPHRLVIVSVWEDQTFALSIAQLQLRGQRAQGCPLLVLSPGSPPQSCLRVQLREDCTTPLQPPSAGRAAENHQDLPETFAPAMLMGGNEVT